MQKIVHLETKVTAVFGVLDDDGNVLRRQPYTFEVPKHDSQIFSKLCDSLVATKKELQERLSKVNKE